MKRRIVLCLLTGTLCILLASCGAKPDPVSKTQPEVQRPASSQPEVQEPPAAQEPSQSPQVPAEALEPSAAEPEVLFQAPEPTPEPAPVPAEEAVDLTGTWRDDQRGTSGGRCFMEITGTSDDYTIDIYWGSSASETHHWQLFGAYDEAAREIPYIGTHFLDTSLDGGNIQQTVMLKGLTGSLRLDDTGALLWNDSNEHTVEGMTFLRES